jgi:hypothetical protein
VKHQGHLLYFLHHQEVEPTNNACERALRPSVIHRKVTNGFRSEWAAKGYTALETVIDTAEIKGRRAFEALVELMGVTVLAFLDAPAHKNGAQGIEVDIPPIAPTRVTAGISTSMS